MERGTAMALATDVCFLAAARPNKVSPVVGERLLDAVDP